MPIVVTVIVAPTSPHRRFTDGAAALDAFGSITTFRRSFSDSVGTDGDAATFALNKKFQGTDSVTPTDSKSLVIIKKFQGTDSVTVTD